MSLSKYPKKMDNFQTKVNAKFEGDPNGHFVMAEDINHLQDSVRAIQAALGEEPQGNRISVGERIGLVEGSSALRVPSFLIYLGIPAKINDSKTTLEASGHFSKYDHIVIGHDAQNPNDPDYALTLEIIELTKRSRESKFYGYIDCGVNTKNLSISEIQIAIRQWMEMGVEGIYCANYGFEHRVTRERQNRILDSIHQYGLVAILDAENPKEVFTDMFHETMNSNWTAPNIQAGDTFHYNSYALDTSTPDTFVPNVPAEIQKLIDLYAYRVDMGIRIFATPVIQTDVPEALAQELYDYAHVSALVTSMDGFHPVIEGYGEGNNVAPTYDWIPVAGNWYSESPRIEYDEWGIVCVRELPFGRIILDTREHTYKYEGLYIPYDMLRIPQNTVDGNLIGDASIEDKKIKNYDGNRLIAAINNSDDEDLRIAMSKIVKISLNDLEGSVSVEALRTNIIDALHANIGHAVISAALIGDLTADKITAGDIDAERIKASVVDAINLYAEEAEIGFAQIDAAVIGDLNAKKITAGDIDAERIFGNVIEAINLSAKQGYIKDLNADNITAGDIKAERIYSEVINAINLYAETADIERAHIDVAVIPDLTAGHMRGSVVEAINLNANEAFLNKAVIPHLDAGHIEASVIDAINANIDKAQIKEAVIEDLSATKITSGDIDADRIKVHVIDAVNAEIENGVIHQAKIGDLDAEKIKAGQIRADVMMANVVHAINSYAQNMEVGSAEIDSAVIGNLDAKHIQGVVVEAINLYANSADIDKAEIDIAAIGDLTAESIKAVVIDAINLNAEDATINKAYIDKLDAEHIQGAVIKAINASIEDAVIDQAQIGNLDAKKITSGDIDAERLFANIFEAINADIHTAVIKEARIEDLSAEKIKTGDIDAERMTTNVITAINADINEAVINSAHIGELDADHIATVVIEAINAKITNATIDSAVIGELTSDNMRTEVIEAINSYTGHAVIGEGKITDLNAGKIKTGTLDAERIKASVVDAINASIDELEASHAVISSAAIGEIDAEKIQASVIKAINAHIGDATIDSAKIAELDADKMTANVIEAVNAHIGDATIDAAKIGELDAENMSANIIRAIELYSGNAVIDAARIEDLDASKITSGDIATTLLTANIIDAINADIQTAKIEAARIEALTAEHIQAEIIEAINASIEDAVIDNAKIGELSVDNMKATVIKAINASIENAVISEGMIDDLSAEKITTGSLAAERIETEVIKAINAEIENGTIDQAKIGDLDAGKITAGDIDVERLMANVVHAVNAYIETLESDAALIDSAAIGVLSTEHMTSKVISAINASIETIEGQSAIIDSAKIGELTSEHIKTAVMDAIHANIDLAVIDAALIGDLDADKITTGDIDAERMTANAITAINADLTDATIESAKVGEMTVEHMQAEVIEAVNASITEATIEGAKIGELEVDNMKAHVIEAINGSFEELTIDNAKIDKLTADHINAVVINAINASIENIKINNAMIDNLTAGHIQAVVVDAINGRFGSATIDSAKIGTLTADNIGANTITTDHIQTRGLDAEVIKSGFLDAKRIRFESLSGDHIASSSIETKHLKAGEINGNVLRADSIHGSKIIAGTLSASNLTAGSITSVEIAAKTIQTRNLSAGAVDATVLRAGTITAEHISTVGLDANQVEVFGTDGQTLIGDGYIKIDGLDAGVVRSDNLAGNGLFQTASSMYGYRRDNPSGEAIIGDQSKVAGSHEMWRIDLTTGEYIAIDTGGTKPVDIAFDYDYEHAYVTLQGDNKVAQIQVSQGNQAARTGVTLNTGTGPGRALYTGDKLMDHKHFFVLNTDPKDVNIPDSLTIIDGPPTSIHEDLYVHHMVPLGNTPYDLKMRMHMYETDLAPGLENPHPGHDMVTYISQAGQGDIAVLDMSHPDSNQWLVTENIPLAAHMTDDYHGGLDGRFGMGHAVGGDASSQYSDEPVGGADPHAAHAAVGYGTSDGSIRTYEPHGIALSSDPNHIYVADYANGHLIVVDVRGEAPYNPLTGSRVTGNLGQMPVPPHMQGRAGTGTIPDNVKEVEGHDIHTHNVDDEGMFSAQHASSHGSGGPSDDDIIHIPGMTGPITQEMTTTKWVRYRIPVGDSPERVEVVDGKVFVTLEGSNAVAIIDEGDILSEIQKDYIYYGPEWNEFTPFRDLPTFHPRNIIVGARPTDIAIHPDESKIYITINGQNQVVEMDIETEEILNRFNTGPNPKGIQISPDGRHLYVVNHGGSGNLSFVYPEGEYIGDAYLGLEGGIEYQGAEHWTPDRSDWVYNANSPAQIESATTVEFHVNEPFLNEGGFAKIHAFGTDPQRGQIEQDIYNVTNYSNGDNQAIATHEQLKQDASLQRFWPKNEWLNDTVKDIVLYARTDEELTRDPSDDRIFYPSEDWIDNPERPVILVGMSGEFEEISENAYEIEYGSDAKIIFNSAIPGDNTVYSSAYYFSEKADPTQYTIYYEDDIETSSTGTTYGGSHITFRDGYLPEGAIVHATYTFRHNRWFQNHNGSILVATENSSSENFYVQFEIDEFVPKFITYDNQQTEDFTYWPIEAPGVTNAEYTGMEYSGETNRALDGTVTSSAEPASGSLDVVIDDAEPMTDGESEGGHMHAQSFSAQHATEPVELPAGEQYVTVDLGATYMITDIHINHAHHMNRTYHGTKTMVSQDNVHWTTIFDSATEGEYPETAYHEGHGVTHFGKHIAIRPQPVRYIRDFANGYTEWETNSSNTEDWTQDTVKSTGTANHWSEIKVFGDWQFEKEFSRNYTSELLDKDIKLDKPQFRTGGVTVTGGEYPASIGSLDTRDITRVVSLGLSSYEYFTPGAGAASVTVDLGEEKVTDHIRVYRYYADGRTHKGVKTEVSKDGKTWTAVYDSAKDGEYEELPEGKLIALGGQTKIRYIRDSAKSWSTTLNTGTVITGTDIRWVGIHAYLDYDKDYPFVYQSETELEGQNMATNGQGIVTTSVPRAYTAIDIEIDFTSWWYMTYIIGPEFGQIDVEMPTTMGGSHSMFQDGPYLNKVAHRHIMSWPNSKNVKADEHQGIKAGKHRAIARQKSGKVSLDRYRFEDYQYLYMNSIEIPKGSATNFVRHKIEPEVAKWHVGRGNQSTEGAYDTVRINNDTGKPDGSVSIKYRMRMRARLLPKGYRQERGVVYVTSAIFETGRLSSHWRMSQTQDSFPGNRIQSWDPNQPHKTGIQNHHIANGAIRGSKLMPHSVMTHHISPYARIEEGKLKLNHATHRHGHFKNIELDNGTVISEWFDNKTVIDSIDGWGESGMSALIARADHTHELIDNDLTVNGTINNVDMAEVKSLIEDDSRQFSQAERDKLEGVSAEANRTESSTNGNIRIDGVDTNVYTHPDTAGSRHIPAGGAANQFLGFDSNGTAKWSNVTWGSVTGKPTTFTPVTATGTTLGGVRIGAGLNIDSGTLTWSHPTGDGQHHVPATGTANANKALIAGNTAGSAAWQTIGFNIVSGTITDAQHGNRSGGNLHSTATSSNAGFMSAAHFSKLEHIEAGANNYTHPNSHSLNMIDETATRKIMTDAERNKLATVAANANNYSHPTGDGNLHIPATGTGNAGKVLKAGSTAGSVTWGNTHWSEIDGKPETFTPGIASSTALGGIRIGDNLTIDASGKLSALNSYTHPSGDGNKHVPADGGTNAGKVLKATNTTGVPTWGNVAWGEVTGKPSTFAPSTHSHSISNVSGLQNALDGKVDDANPNTFTALNTFTTNGMAIRIQPSGILPQDTAMFQIANSRGNSLITMGTGRTDDSAGRIVINGDLEVTGDTIQKATQDIQGDMVVSGFLNVEGDVTLGNTSSHTTIGNTMHIVGDVEMDEDAIVHKDLKVGGDIIPMGKAVETARFPVYGIAGDLQFETSAANVFQEIVGHIDTFDTGGGSLLEPAHQEADRQYKLKVVYSTEGAGDAQIRITQDDGTSIIHSETLPGTNRGVKNKARTWMSAPFTTNHIGDTVFQAQKNTGGALAIRYIEIVALDQYRG